jgi:hypothetical protein
MKLNGGHQRRAVFLINLKNISYLIDIYGFLLVRGIFAGRLIAG